MGEMYISSYGYDFTSNKIDKKKIQNQNTYSKKKIKIRTLLLKIATKWNSPNWEQPNQQQQTEWSLPRATNNFQEIVIAHNIKKRISNRWNKY